MGILLLSHAIYPEKHWGYIPKAMIVIFKEMIGDTVECYIDD